MTLRSRLAVSIVTLLLLCAGCNSQPAATAKHADQAPATQASSEFPTTSNPRDTLPFLASDALAGRAPGTPGIERAGDFLATEFARIGLQRLPGTDGYFQPFPMALSTSLAPGTGLSINDKPLQLSTDFSPLSLTGEGPFSGHVVFAGYSIVNPKFDEYAGIDAGGKVVLAMRQEPVDQNKKSRFAAPNQNWSDGAFFSAKAKAAAAHGAVALLLVSPPSSGGDDQVLPFFGDTAGSGAKIPVIQISRRVADLLLEMGGAPDLKSLQAEIDSTLSPRSVELKDVEVAGDVAVKRSTASVRNVLAYLPGAGEHADEFVVVGAHYDHLGTGQLGHMLGPVGSIYHGADDNASGTAAVLELAERMKAAGPLPRSVLFALFTGEEEGLIGSDYFIKHPPVPLDKIVAMINLDMVGRMKNDTVLMGGWGTAPIWESMMKQAAADVGVKTQSFEKGGLGPSDHMSFALKKIPVLFLFTGLHKDYHRPTDTADKINYAGIDRAVDLTQRLVAATAAMPRQQYDGSNDSKATMAFATGHGAAGVGGGQAALGVVPDYSSMDATDGVHITGVGGGSPAEAAGLQPGDVLTRWNDKPLNNLQDLSDDLAQANPGDAVQITVLRDGKTVTVRAKLGTRKK